MEDIEFSRTGIVSPLEAGGKRSVIISGGRNENQAKMWCVGEMDRKPICMGEDLGVQAEWLVRYAGIGLYTALEISVNFYSFQRAIESH